MPSDIIEAEGSYSAFSAYASRSPASYAEFDLAIQNEIDLFSRCRDIDIASIDRITDEIMSALPSLKRIFASPILRLRDSEELLPTEAVKHIVSKTLSHISIHSELWEDVRAEMPVPRKLMAIRCEDDHALYENIIFAHTVDAILRFTSMNLARLRDILYADRKLSLELLERESHPLYFLAMGKLGTSCIRDHDKYLLPLERCCERLSAIEHALRPRLSMPVYKNCRKQNMKLPLKRTNVFRSHKAYKRLYSLAKFLSENEAELCSEREERADKDGYFSFCLMLSIFAAGHFNYSFADDQRIDLNNADMSAVFRDWRLNIRSEGGGIMLTTLKDRVYRILICPGERAASSDADEVILVGDSAEDRTRLSVYDIESFRRIQQMLLRAMIYSDDEHEVCPFCGRSLKPSSRGFECGACRTVIETAQCPKTGGRYYMTTIKYLRTPQGLSGDRTREGLYHYRNITEIGEEGELICPECGEIH